jgi:hypothetical protein
MKRTPKAPEVVTQERARPVEQVPETAVEEVLDKRSRPPQEPPISPLTDEELKLAEEEEDRRAAERARELREQDPFFKYAADAIGQIPKAVENAIKLLKSKTTMSSIAPKEVDQAMSLLYLLQRGRVDLKEQSRLFLTNVGVNACDHELVLQLINAAREGDDMRLAAVRRVFEAPAAEVAPPPLQLPDEIPEGQWYRNRPEGQTLRQFLGLDPNPPEFKEGWPAPYIRAKTLSLPELKRLDPSTHTALYHTKEGRALRQDLVPRKQDLITETLTHVDRAQIREADRLKRAMERRGMR